MTTIGVNTWVWVSPLRDSDIESLAPQVRDWGFDVLELPVENPGDWDPGRASEVLARHGLGATVVAVMPPGRDLTTLDRRTVEETQAYLRHCVDVATRVGSDVVAGPIYRPVGDTPRFTATERAAALEQLARNLGDAVDYAGERGVRLGIEPLNRFETSLVNTVAQGVEIVDAVGSPACGVALDTFHMNIEEKDPAAAVRAAGDRIVHVQACGNDRGAPGSGYFDWSALRDALADVGYRGAWCIESFTPDNATIARAASVWRPLERSQDAIATDGLRFLRGVLD